MHLITIPLQDETLARVQARAAREGFPSPEAFIGGYIESYLTEDQGGINAFFTTQIIAEIDEAVTEADNAPGITLAEMRAQTNALSQSWQN